MSPCEEFTGTINKVTGYGAISRGGKVGVPAHRYFYELHNGPIPKGMVIMHLCDNRRCVNPEHLKAGTQSENMLDCVAKGRHPDYRGELSTSAKLTDDCVHAIRASSLSSKELSIQFNVARRTISDVLSRKTWRHI